MPLQIRKLSSNDAALLERMADKLLAADTQKPSADHLKTLLADNRTHLYAVLEEGPAIGYALVYTFPSLYESAQLAYLYDIEVLPGQRRRGAGTMLMQALLADLKRLGVVELYLGTATDNHAAQALFRATGGLPSGETFNDFTWEF